SKKIGAVGKYEKIRRTLWDLNPINMLKDGLEKMGIKSSFIDKPRDEKSVKQFNTFNKKKALDVLNEFSKYSDKQLEYTKLKKPEDKLIKENNEITIDKNKRQQRLTKGFLEFEKDAKAF